MTELIWDGKYKDGKKQGPVRIALPFQTIETVNESAQEFGGYRAVQDPSSGVSIFPAKRGQAWRATGWTEAAGGGLTGVWGWDRLNAVSPL